MQNTYGDILALTKEFGSPLYLFDERAFEENYQHLLKAFRKWYDNYNIAYSYKTNYTPYVARTVKKLGGYAEVVSEMEYHIAKQLGYEDKNIIFNGPNKGQCGADAFLNGCMVNVDSLSELESLIEVAKNHPQEKLQLGIRINLDLGQNFVSRFGIDEEQLPLAFEKVKKQRNLTVAGIHCHISRCRDLKDWKKRAEIMLELADRYFGEPPYYIDLGSGMFGSMEESLAMQFDRIPTYEEYAEAVARTFAEHYRGTERKPILFTEPGTTLINRFVNMISKVEGIKEVRGKVFAVLDCSVHNLGETSILKELPLQVVSEAVKNVKYDSVDFVGYTCLEQDVIRRNYAGNLSIGDYVIFGNVGGYSNVLKPPFIRPNCAMIARNHEGNYELVKKAETFEDILRTYVF